MSLSKIIAEVTATHEAGGVVDRHAAIEDAVPMVLADKALTEQLVRTSLSVRIKQFLCRAVHNAEESIVSGQGSFFGLRAAHAREDGDGMVKQTRALNRIEMAGLISVRRRQVTDDAAYLQRLEEAVRQTAPIWDRHPRWSWGQVEDAYTRIQRAA